VALEKQPFFSAPSIPKLGKNTVSSSIFSSVSKSKPQLKTTPFSFFKPIQPQKEQGQDVTKTLTKIVSGENSKDKQIYSTLVETNRILVEIQKQLSLDFASRITEKKQSLSSLRTSILKKRAVQKEKAIESINNDSGLIRGAFDKITAPAKSIFDRIIQFLTTIATGFLVNAAFSWLSDEKNRQKLLEVFKFLTNHWKWLVGIFIGAKLVGAIIKIVNLVRRLKGLVELIRRVWGKPPKPPSGGTSPKGGGPGPGPGTPDFCKGVYACIAGGIAQYVKLFTPYFQPISIPTTPPGGVRPPIPVAPIFQPGPNNPIGQKPLTTPQQTPWYNTPLAQGLGYGALGLGLGALTVGALASPFEGPAGEMTAGSATLGAFGRAGQAFRTLSGGGRNIQKASPRSGTTLSREAMSRMLGKETESQLVKRIIDIYKKERGIQIKANNLEELADLLGVTVDSLVKGFSRRGAAGLPQILGKSQGGTVGGTGPGNVDSVPAMLAPGEEVVRASEAMRWRPLLKDINDNGATMWNDFTDAIKKQEENNTYQRQINFQFSNQLNDLNSELENLINQEKNKKIKDAGVKITPPVIGNIPPQEGTGRGGPSDVNPPVPQVPGRPTKAPEPFTGSVPADGGQVSQPSPTPAPAPQPAPAPRPTQTQTEQPIQPISEPTPSIPSQPSGPTQVKVEPFRPETSFITPIKQPQKSYALKPASKPNVSIAPFSLPPIVSQSSGGEMAQKSVSDASSPPDVYSTNRSNNYIAYAANAYGLVQ
jgi:hypothetical protein